MLTKRIIPCLDIKDGRVVKGINFINLKDAGDPVENARFYDEQGADELVFLDITASHEKRDTTVELVKKVADTIFLPFTVGGGIRSIDDIRGLLIAGCDKVSINTAAIQDPGFVKKAASRFGSQCIVVAIDAKCRVKTKSVEKWEVFINGGRTPTGIDAIAWAKKMESFGSDRNITLEISNFTTMGLQLIQNVPDSDLLTLSAQSQIKSGLCQFSGNSQSNAAGSACNKCYLAHLVLEV